MYSIKISLLSLKHQVKAIPFVQSQNLSCITVSYNQEIKDGAFLMVKYFEDNHKFESQNLENSTYIMVLEGHY